jgi:DNA-binding transcriptional LysR family regulator
MENVVENRHGDLLLGASTIAGQYILPYFLKGFKESYPNINISMQVADTEKIYTLVAQRNLDVGVVGAWMKNPKVESLKWMPDELVILVPRHHKLADRKQVEIKSLLAERWVFREQGSGTRMVTEEILARLGISKEDLNIQIEVGSSEAVVAAVEADLGIALISKHAVEAGKRSETVRALRVAGNEAQQDIYIIYPHQKSRRMAVEHFLHYLLSNQAVLPAHHTNQ